jgi:excisionase family DNA binding protein
MYTSDTMELMTIQETAHVLRVSPLTVRRFIAAGQLSAIRAGKGVRVRKESVEQFIQPVEPKREPDLQPGDTETATGASKGRPLTFEDPLWELVGSATEAQRTDAGKKYEYLAEALAANEA